MSKQETIVPQDINNVKFYKKASFAWVVVISITLFLSGTAFGWVQRSSHESQVKAEAMHIVENLAKKDQK